MACNRDHSNLEFLLGEHDIGPGQRGAARHICCFCAYLKGKRDRELGKTYDPSSIASLDDSQAGVGRHRNAAEMYNVGYKGSKY